MTCVPKPFRPFRHRWPAAVLSAAVVLASAAGCALPSAERGGSPEAPASAAAIPSGEAEDDRRLGRLAAAAVRNTARVSSLTARGDDGAGRTSVVRLDREGRCSGIHHKEEGRVDVLRLRGAFYIRLNAAEIRRNGRADWSPAVAEEKVGRFAGRWMEMNPQAGPFQGLARACDPTHFSGRLEEMARGLEEGRPGFRELRREPADLRGEPVIRVTAPQGPAVLSVSTGRKPYLVALDEGPRVRASFEDFGEPVVAEHPDPADLESFLDFIGQARDTGPARTAGARHATAITK